jgi:hypothetical protein
MLQLAVWVYVGASAALIAWNAAQRRDLEVLPSLVWLVLMTLPFAVQFETFPESARGLQAAGIMLIGTALLLADSLGPAPAAVPGVSKAAAWMLADYRFYAALFIALMALQLLLLERIPLVEKFVHRVEDPRALAEMREDASKLLPVHDLVKYSFTWAISILAPLTVVFMAYRRLYIGGALFLVVAILCAAVSLAKAPVYLLLAYLTVLALSAASFRQRCYGYAAVAALGLPVAWMAGAFLLQHPESIFHHVPPDDRATRLALPAGDPRAALTYGDLSRLKPLDARDELSVFERSVNSYTYRVFLGPSDVSSRWYQYFPAVSDGFIGFKGLRPEDRKQAGTQHPARLVGSWAYRERFPDKYLETVQAYASVDADAYARYGVGGIVAVAFLVAGLRLLLKWLHTGSVLTRTLYTLAVMQLAVLLPIASLQAILLPQGVAVIVGLMALARYAEGAARKREIAREARA